MQVQTFLGAVTEGIGRGKAGGGGRNGQVRAIDLHGFRREQRVRAGHGDLDEHVGQLVLHRLIAGHGAPEGLALHHVVPRHVKHGFRAADLFPRGEDDRTVQDLVPRFEPVAGQNLEGGAVELYLRDGAGWVDAVQGADMNARIGGIDQNHLHGPRGVAGQYHEMLRDRGIDDRHLDAVHAVVPVTHEDIGGPRRQGAFGHGPGGDHVADNRPGKSAARCLSVPARRMTCATM